MPRCIHLTSLVFRNLAQAFNTGSCATQEDCINSGQEQQARPEAPGGAQQVPSSAVKGQAQNTLPDKDGGQANAELRAAPAVATAAVERATQAPRRRLLQALADAEAGRRKTKERSPGRQCLFVVVRFPCHARTLPYRYSKPNVC